MVKWIQQRISNDSEWKKIKDKWYGDSSTLFPLQYLNVFFVFADIPNFVFSYGIVRKIRKRIWNWNFAHISLAKKKRSKKVNLRRWKVVIISFEYCNKKEQNNRNR